ncbi:YihY/virulence factor BrkB family protein [Parasedimentitalea maritima]|uniref:YihY/virulence factor BrkB family protein n=1 Tax=Parasedimentitalea maritima TaxID=2578117 RepID=A0ABY2UPT8_9RHOB|nr:YihY/virulence factor BrkB family protein [Zongyanglinia marina]TLP56835.1 YihY/virulence factor BrkB family protein [Zongyanglinia marina]
MPLTFVQALPPALVAAAKRFNRKQGWVLSSHIAMSMMLALFPFVLFTVALAGAIAGALSQDVQLDDMLDLLFGAWPQAVAEPIVRELYAVLAASNSKLMTLGGVLALYFASNGVDAVRLAMVQAYRDSDSRPFWKSRLLCLMFVILGGAGIMAVAFFEFLLPLFVLNLAEYFPQLSISQGWETGVNGLLVALIPLIAVLGCHVWLPGHLHSLVQILPGAALTVLLWWVASWGFSVYVGGFARYSATYAGLAGAMAALMFLYLNAAILIFGAEFNGALIRTFDEEDQDVNSSKDLDASSLDD